MPDQKQPRPFTRKQILLSVLAVLVVPPCLLLAGLFLFIGDDSNPYAKEDICFKKDTPGATDRYRTYQPVRCSSPSVELGPSIGADFAVLKFKDIDNDGNPEMIVQPSALWCRFSLCFDVTKTTARVRTKSQPAVEVIRTESLDDLGFSGKN